MFLQRVPMLDLAMMKSLKLVAKAPLPTETQPQLPETQVPPTRSKRQAVEDMVEVVKNGDKAGGKVRYSPVLSNLYLTRLSATMRCRTVFRFRDGIGLA